MIDSVTLEIESSEYTKINQRFFDGFSARRINEKFSIQTKFVDKFHKQKIAEGFYFPIINITSSQRSLQKIIIQVSLPKLIFNENLRAIRSDDADMIYSKIIESLNSIDIQTSVDIIKKAKIKRIDFTRVIKIPSFFGDASSTIETLRQFNVKPHCDFQYRSENFKKDSAYLKFWNNSQSYVIYNKTMEILSNSKTSEEKKLAMMIRNGDLKNNLVKFEVSLHKKQSVDRCLYKHIKIKKDFYSLPDVFKKPKIANDVLLENFNQVYRNEFVKILSLSDMRENEIEKIINKAKLSISKKSQLYYWLNKAIKYDMGTALFEMKRQYSTATFNRYKKDMQNILNTLQIPRKPPQDIINFLRDNHKNKTS